MAGYAGLGTILSIGGTDVAEVTSISGPGVSADTIDVSSHDSLADEDAYRTYVAGLLDGGEVSLEGNLTTAVAGNVIMTALEARVTSVIVITFPAAAGVATWTFDGLITSFETNAPHDGKLGFSASIKVSGQPVLA
jgi:predicted secreted protein